MQRWHLGLGLSFAAILAAIVVPQLGVRVTDDGTPPSPAPPRDVVDADGEGLSLHASLDRSAVQRGGDTIRHVVIDVWADERSGAQRVPVDLAVVLDMSGSMIEKGRIEAARLATSALLDGLGAEDRFSLVSFSDQASVRVPLGSVRAPELLHQVIDRMEPEGGTNLGEGLREGILQLRGQPGAGIRRVVLLSDGLANIGLIDDDALVRLAASGVQDSVTVSALGLGLEFNEDLLASISDAGGGRYHFVDRPDELASLLREELASASATVAREVMLDLEMADGVELLDVYGWSTPMTGDGTKIFLGDLRGGERRKVVARVRVPDGALGEVAVAHARLSGVEAEDSEAIRLGASVEATVTDDAARVGSSRDRDAAVQSARAMLGEWMDASARLLASGQQAEATRALEDAERQVESWALDEPEVRQALDEVGAQRQAVQAAPPASPEASYHVKRAKERARDLSQ